MTFKRHLLILVFVTVIVRGMMFIAYPMGGGDDDQSAQRYLIDELLHGQGLIGNLRYAPGYALAMAPVYGAAQGFERVDDRIVLFVQVALASTIPFMVYDMLRRRQPPRHALIVALVVAVNPFGLQWAHLALPPFLIAVCVVAALWLIDRSLGSARAWRPFAAAGMLLGAAAVMRLETVVIGAAVGLWLFLRGSTALQRLIPAASLSAGLFVVVSAFFVFVHQPSTQTWTPSCYSGVNLLFASISRGVPMIAADGEATTHLLSLLSLPPLQPIAFTRDIYPRWREADAWASASESAAFLNQPPTRIAPDDQLLVTFPGTLIYYLGPCEVDALLRQSHHEMFIARPSQWLSAALTDWVRLWLQQPAPGMSAQFLPRPERVIISAAGPLGMVSAGGGYYTGQWVWLPGIAAYTAVSDGVNVFKGLLPLALIMALYTRERLYAVCALLLLVYFTALIPVNTAQPRIYAVVYPLVSIVYGAGLAVLIDWVIRRFRKT